MHLNFVPRPERWSKRIIEDETLNHLPFSKTSMTFRIPLVLPEFHCSDFDWLYKPWLFRVSGVEITASQQQQTWLAKFCFLIIENSVFSKSGAVIFFSCTNAWVRFRHLERVRKTRKNENEKFCHFLLIFQSLLNIHFRLNQSHICWMTLSLLFAIRIYWPCIELTLYRWFLHLTARIRTFIYPNSLCFEFVIRWLVSKV